MKRFVILFLLLNFSFKVFSQKIDKTEADLIKLVEANYNDTFKLLEEVVNINSGTLNKEGVRQVGEIFKREFDKIGFQTEWISLPDSMNRVGHFVATRKGNRGKKLFLIGHLDTVFEKSMEFSPFTIVNDSTASGQGVNDMKGGDVMILASLKALHQLNLLEDRQITVYFTGDEEESGKPTSVSRADFIERAKACDVALGYETTAGFGIATTARRGASGWTLIVTGKQAHSSGVFSDNVGFGSIYEAARILNEFRETLSNEKYLTFNPGQIVGGSFVNYDETEAKGISLGKTNIVAKRTIVTGDLRFLTENQKIVARKKMQEIVKKNLKQASAQIRFKDGIPSMPPTEGNRNIMKVLSQVSVDLGMGAVKEGDPGSRGAGKNTVPDDFIVLTETLPNGTVKKYGIAFDSKLTVNAPNTPNQDGSITLTIAYQDNNWENLVKITSANTQDKLNGKGANVLTTGETIELRHYFRIEGDSSPSGIPDLTRMTR